MDKSGYIKANKLANENIIRRDMEGKNEWSKIDINQKDIEELVILTLNNNFSIGSEKTSFQTKSSEWISISNKYIENNIDEILQDYELRTKIIDEILKTTKNAEIKGINIDFKNINGLCIGEQTAETAKKYGIQTIISEKATLNSMIDKLKEVLIN